MVNRPIRKSKVQKRVNKTQSLKKRAGKKQRKQSKQGKQGKQGKQSKQRARVYRKKSKRGGMDYEMDPKIRAAQIRHQEVKDKNPNHGETTIYDSISPIVPIYDYNGEYWVKSGAFGDFGTNKNATESVYLNIQTKRSEYIGEINAPEHLAEVKVTKEGTTYKITFKIYELDEDGNPEKDPVKNRDGSSVEPMISSEEGGGRGFYEFCEILYIIKELLQSNSSNSSDKETLEQIFTTLYCVV
jgi:hypothetical protein